MVIFHSYVNVYQRQRGQRWQRFAAGRGILEATEVSLLMNGGVPHRAQLWIWQAPWPPKTWGHGTWSPMVTWRAGAFVWLHHVVAGDFHSHGGYPNPADGWWWAIPSKWRMTRATPISGTPYICICVSDCLRYIYKPITMFDDEKTRTSRESCPPQMDQIEGAYRSWVEEIEAQPLQARVLFLGLLGTCIDSIDKDYDCCDLLLVTVIKIIIIITKSLSWYIVITMRYDHIIIIKIDHHSSEFIIMMSVDVTQLYFARGQDGTATWGSSSDNPSNIFRVNLRGFFTVPFRPISTHMGVSINGVPPNGWFIKENPI